MSTSTADIEGEERSIGQELQCAANYIEYKTRDARKVAGEMTGLRASTPSPTLSELQEAERTKQYFGKASDGFVEMSGNTLSAPSVRPPLERSRCPFSLLTPGTGDPQAPAQAASRPV